MSPTSPVPDVDTPAEFAGSVFESAVRSKAAELKRELIRQTLEDIESWRKAVDLEWQRAHPDQWSGSPIPPEEIETYQNTVRNDYYEWVEPAFEKRLQPDPDAINPMIAALRTIESMFGGSQDNAGNFSPASPALARINDVRTDISFWQGDLQTNFIDNFLTPLQTVSMNQAAAAKLVREQLECCKILYIRYRKAILDLLDQAIGAVKTLNNQRDPEAHMWGTLIGISLGTAVMVIPGIGWAIGGAVLVASSTIAQGLAPDPPKTFEVSAPTAQEVAVKVSEALSKLSSTMLDEERQVEEAFRNVYNGIADSRRTSINNNTAGPLAVAVPDVCDAKPAEILDGSFRPHD